MMLDAQGLEVASGRAETVAAIDTFVRQALAYGTDFQPILDAAQAEPACVMAGTLAASLMMWMEAGEAPALARPHLENCRAGLAAATAREKQWFAATEAWVGGDLPAAIAGLEAVTDQWPRDLFAMKLVQYHYFNQGRVAEMLAVCDKVLPANQDNGYVRGCRAFGLEQNYRYEEAEAEGRAAVAIERSDAWAHHAVAHVMEMQGRYQDGIDWLSGLAETWEPCTSFMYTHNWWHLALFHLDAGDQARVLEIYDKHVWGRDKSYSQDQIGAASLLWRLELRGIDVGGRWADVAEHVAARTGEHVQPFLDLQYLYALARANRKDAVTAMLDSMARHAAEAPAFRQAALAEVALPAARGLAAYAAGDYAAAHGHLAPAVPRLQEIGGSHAQRDLFVQTWLDVLLKTGRAAEALPDLQARTEARPNTAHGFELLRAATE